MSVLAWVVQAMRGWRVFSVPLSPIKSPWYGTVTICMLKCSNTGNIKGAKYYKREKIGTPIHPVLRLSPLRLGSYVGPK